MENNYISNNRGFITASKLKTFIRSPEEFYLKYIKEVESPKPESKALQIGSLFDELISYGEDKFFEKYYIDKGYKKSELVQEVEKAGLHPEPNKLLVQDLKDLLYSEKEKITTGDGELLLNMLNEVKRQPLFDFNGQYEAQKEFTAKYKNLKLKGTLDRFDRKYNKIRDLKTTKSLEDFLYNWSSLYQYDLSMSFYWLIVYIGTGVDCELFLDVVEKQYPYRSRIFKIPKEIVKQNILFIKSKLDELAKKMEEYEKTNDEFIWINQINLIEDLKNLEYYPKMLGVIQQDFEYLS